MTLYRIVESRFKNDLSGEGARLYGGRWNSAGTAMVYTSGSISLSILEMLAHTPRHLDPTDLVLLYMEIPSSHFVETPSKLPNDWRAYPAPDSIRSIGDDFVRSGHGLLLRVPSVIVPEEYNYLINPLYADAKKIKIARSEKFEFDSRLKG